MSVKIPDQTGKIFGFLKILQDFIQKPCGKDRKLTRFVLAECENCESVPKEYLFSNVRSGHTKSCGCLTKQPVHTKTHGLSDTRQYKIWQNMKNRCKNPSYHQWEYYGGRGITVCDKWLKFQGFWEDMEDEYLDDLQLDRVNVNGNYCKENCRWVSLSEQAYNTRLQKNNSSSKTGVYYRKYNNKWQARIYINGKLTQLGCFETFEEAVEAREKAELEIYGYNKE